MSEPVNHHFIPQFYLRNFAEGNGRKAQLFTFDKKTHKSMKPKVRNVGSQRHFNRIDYPNFDPNFFEKAVADMESIVAPHLQDVIEVNYFPTEEHYISIINLIAHVCHRNPKKRNTRKQWFSQISKALLEITAKNPEYLESENKRLQTIDPTLEPITTNDLKDFIKDDNLEIHPDQTYTVSEEFLTLQPIIETMYRRHWRFAVAPENSHFITSDNPSILDWEDPNYKSIYPPGHGCLGTVLLFPLSPRILLVGTHEEATGIFNMTPEQVAGINSMLFYTCHRQIYAKDSMFDIEIKEKGIIKGIDMPKFILPEFEEF